MTEIDRGLLGQSMPTIQNAQNVFLREHGVEQTAWFVAEQDPDTRTGLGIYTVCENGEARQARLNSYVVGYTFPKTIKLPPNIVKAVPFESIDSVQEVACSLPGDLNVTWEKLSQSIAKIAAERAFMTGGIASRLEFGKGWAVAVEMFGARFPSKESEENLPKKILAERQADIEERIASEEVHSGRFDRSAVVRDGVRTPILRRFHTDPLNGIEEIHFLEQKYEWLLENEKYLDYRLTSITKMDDDNRDHIAIVPANLEDIERTTQMYEYVDALIAGVKAGNLHFGSFKIRQGPNRPGVNSAQIFCQINGDSHLFSARVDEVDGYFDTTAKGTLRPQGAIFKIIHSRAVESKTQRSKPVTKHTCLIARPAPSSLPNYFYNGHGKSISYAEDILSETPEMKAFRSPEHDGGWQFNSRYAIFTKGLFLEQ